MDSDQIFALVGLLFFAVMVIPRQLALRGSLPGAG